MVFEYLLQKLWLFLVKIHLMRFTLLQSTDEANDKPYRTQICLISKRGVSEVQLSGT